MEKKEKNKNWKDAVAGMSLAEHIQRHGEAASQMIQANKGVRYHASGMDLGHKGRSLQKISEYKLNERMREQNIKQQAGFSAELVEEARKNQRNILEGNKVRLRTTDGIGQTNHQQYDFVEVDENGSVIPASGIQMKFLGVDKAGRYTVIEKIVKDPNYKKYDTVIEIPKDQYDGAVAYAENQAQKLRQQAEVLRSRGNLVKSEELEAKADQYLDSVNKIQKSELTLEEARNARLHPDEFTAKEVLGSSIEAGLQAMTAAAFFSGTISMAQNMMAVIAGEKDLGCAVADTLKTTAGAGASAMFVGTAGTVLKASMHTSKAQFIRCLGNSCAPTVVATSMLQLSKGLIRFAKGEITPEELFAELGEKSICSLAAGLGSGLGGLAGSELAAGIGGSGMRAFGSVAGGVAGGMVTYTLCCALYHNISRVIKEEKLVQERRKYLEAVCASAVQKMDQCRVWLDGYQEQNLRKNQCIFRDFFTRVDAAVAVNDFDGICNGFQRLGQAYGYQMQFQDYQEFDQFMRDEHAVLHL